MAKNKQIPSKISQRLDASYIELLDSLKERIQKARVRAGLAVNRELIMLYWQIGKDILQQQSMLGWGAKVIDQLAKDLKSSFPDMTGFSSRNLKYMRAFAELYPDEKFVQAAPAQITWYHNCTLLDKVRDDSERNFYISQRFNMAGVAQFWSIKSRADYIADKEKLKQIFRIRFRLCSPNWPNRFSKILTILIFSG